MNKLAKFRNPSRIIMAVAFVGALLVSLMVSGAAVVNPTTQPTMTMAPYAVKSYALDGATTKAYRPWFENYAWQGDLIEYNVDVNGILSSDMSDYIGAVPAQQGTTNWSARSVFAAKEADPDNISGDESIYWKSRSIFTMVDGTQKNFWWDQLNTTQRAAIDPSLQTQQTLDGDTPAAEDSIVLNYLRGQRRWESDQIDGYLRKRYSVLGAIINSGPVYMNDRVYVGANDGMLHAFNAANGEEVFAYIPSMVVGSLRDLAYDPYRFKFTVDGQLRAAAYLSGADIKRALTGGLGAGSKGLFALDITNKDSGSVMWEKTADLDSDMGYVHGRPTIAPLTVGGSTTWYVISGNGFGSTTGQAALYVVRLNDGYLQKKINAGAAGANGLAAPVLVDYTGDGRADLAYAGDLKGNLWRFDLRNLDLAPTLLYAAGDSKPITVEPDVARHVAGGLMIYFGTGSLLSRTDAGNGDTQSIYGIWDRWPVGYPEVADGEGEGGDEAPAEEGCDTATLPITAGELQVQNLISVSIANDGLARVAVPVEADEEDTCLKRGWVADLPVAGERLIGHPQIRAGRLQFVSINPTVSGIDNWYMQLGWLDGGEYGKALFDINGDGYLTDLENASEERAADAVTHAGEDRYPVGVNLGEGNSSQPTIIRVGPWRDRVYINRFILPEAVSSGTTILGGNVDVMTDSPYGPRQPVTETLYSFKNSDYPHCRREVTYDMGDNQGENIQQVDGYRHCPELPNADGLSGHVDGHVHAYDKIHGVLHIDLLNLEPRRDLARLDAVVDAEGTPVTVQQELNRVTEVASSSATPIVPIPEDQKFIVTLTNADLSQEIELRVGCRTWKVYDYQKMITTQLLNNSYSNAGFASPSSLQDTYHGNQSLIFTLDDITGATCADGKPSTIRLTIEGRVGSKGVLQGTLPGCVNNTHTLGKGYDYAVANESDGSVRNAANNPITHVTVNKFYAGNDEGYRWRNGALTLQLLAVNADNTAAYTLQPKAHLPRVKNVSIDNDKNNGGVYAHGFQIVGSGNNAVPAMLDAGTHNGLLYELATFWNYGDMFEARQEGHESYCAGTQGAAQVTMEDKGLNWSDYKKITYDVGLTNDSELIVEYAALLDAIAALVATCDEDDAVCLAEIEDELNELLADLAALLDSSPELARYHNFRKYVTDHTDKTGDNLLDIDQSMGGGGEEAEGPGGGEDAGGETPGFGGEVYEGRRSWIDLTP